MLLNLLYISIIIIYALSVLGYFVDFIQNNQKVNKLAFWLLSIVAILQTIFIIIRTVEYNRLPLMTIFEGMFIYAWILVIFSLVISRFSKLDFLLLVVNIIGFVILTISIFAPTDDISPRLSDLLILELLVIHVTLLLLAYGLLTLSFSLSVLYAVQHHLLKQKRWGKKMVRIGNLSVLERFSYIFTLIGLPLMLLGVIQGIVWTWLEFDQIPWLDLKVISSFLVMIAYSVYLFQWAVKKQRGYGLALFNIAAFLLLLINYFLSSSFSNFHIW
ncbi:cytochrome C assembly family protein [Evansella cellulosilytica]|uniref:Cytochrome c assembly protein n=1 Tax=Evansella cellulosilytica (strain ATCC 21833 / DSM 2522 / FERM P-1141 / JCM 9156 / N-4) TaxID=649639 RepID=E6TZR6_EVAC2|nr:cytochrome c biogenesis protein CcsA [Evansella cellulosilytica]ADU31372.1 cytochrome c assembly protein [Evansella cellulosilytica DSM 2522]